MTTLSHTRNIRTGDLSKKNERDSSVYAKNISLKKRGRRDIIFSSWEMAFLFKSLIKNGLEFSMLIGGLGHLALGVSKVT